MSKDFSTDSIISKVEALVLPHLATMGLELVDIEFLQDGGYWYLRIFIENPEGNITVENCANLSNKIDEEVDLFIEQKFFLEVSSPGVERPLKKIEDFIRFKDETISIALKHKLNDKKNYTGILTDVEAEEIIVLEISDTETLRIPLKEIKKANIVYIFEDLD